MVEDYVLPRRLLWTVHALAACVLVAIARREAPAPYAAPAIPQVIAFSTLYAVGLTQRLRNASTWFWLWFVSLSTVWVSLLLKTPVAAWLVFSLLLLILRSRRATVAVLAIATAAVVASALHDPPFGLAGVMGMSLALTAGVATVWSHRAVVDIAVERRQLLVDLREARSEVLDAERLSGMLMERERLAHEIHDTVAQGLAALHHLLGAAARQLPPDHPAVPSITDARALATENLGEARRVISALSPSSLESGSLGDALRRLSSATARQYGIDVECFADEVVGLSPGVEDALFRIAQSAVANVVQHAEAGRLTLTLRERDDGVLLAIDDDGRGFDPRDQQTGRADSFGLRAMRSRCLRVGGDLVVRSEPGLGTSVVVTVCRDVSPAKATR